MSLFISNCLEFSLFVFSIRVLGWHDNWAMNGWKKVIGLLLVISGNSGIQDGNYLSYKAEFEIGGRIFNLIFLVHGDVFNFCVCLVE